MAGKSEYEDIDAIRDVDGVVAVISSRKGAPGQMAVAFFKEFTRNGEVGRSAFLQRRHLAALRRLIERAEEKMDAMADVAHAAAREASARSSR